MDSSNINRSGIYEIRNTVSGVRYVGSASNLRVRFKYHRWSLRRGKHTNSRLQQSFNKHGMEVFSFVVLAFLERRMQLYTEQKLLDQCFSSGEDIYNFSRNARAPMLGIPMKAETKEKLSLSKKGKSNGLEGRKYSPEHCANIAAGLRGKKLSPEHKAKLAAAKRGSRGNNTGHFWALRAAR